MIAGNSLRWPRIVAESLRDVATPLACPKRGRRWVPVNELMPLLRVPPPPPRHDGPSPAYLLPHQVDAWRRVVAALRRHGGALLAEDVGCGKTWIALAAAGALDLPVWVIAPAILERQWRDVAVRTGVAIGFHSHERLSRGTPPPDLPGLAIVDESHRFRNAATQRVRLIAPWLVGRATLLCTATPIVNGIGDLATLLDLIVGDDALGVDGVESIAALPLSASPPRALDRLVVRSVAMAVPIARKSETLTPGASEEARARRGIAAIATLRLSRRPAISRLVRTTFLDAIASSDAAFIATLHRYRALLMHARDAGGASRAFLRRFAGQSLDQFTLWPLLDACADDGDLELDDMPPLDCLIARYRSLDHSWIAPLRAILLDGVPTVCFTRHTATARALRSSIAEATAWVTGIAAGVGTTRLPREQVLAAFGPGRSRWKVMRRVPAILVATDVAAEGLDLQGAGRIVHVDIPWTAMRRDQREGRVARIGQAHPSVVVLTRAPASVIEAILAPDARVRRKSRVASRWLADLERAPLQSGGGAVRGVLVTVVRTRGTDAAVVLAEVSRGATRSLRRLEWCNGVWSETDRDLESLLDRAMASPAGEIPESALAALFADAASHLARPGLIRPPHAGPLAARIHRMAAAAARHRNPAHLEALDRVLRFISSPRNRGGRMLTEQLTISGPEAILRAAVPDRPLAYGVTVTIRAALVFRSEASPLR